MFPLIAEPDLPPPLPGLPGLPEFVIELVTITVICDGTLLGGSELLPGLLFHVPPQIGGFVFVEFAKPLKLAGAAPPLSLFTLDHFAPQKVTLAPI